MSTVLSQQNGLLAAARALVARHAWEELRLILAARTGIESSPELAILLAEAELRTGRLQSALLLLQQIVPALARDGGRVELRHATNMLGAAHFELGNLTEAEAAFGLALELAAEAQADVIVGRATNNLALIANSRGRPDRALMLYRLTIPAYQRIGDTRGLAETFHNMAISFRDLDDLNEADRHEQRAIEFARAAGSLQIEAMATSGRAELNLRRGHLLVSEAGAMLAAERFASIPDPVGHADALRIAGAARIALGSIERAKPLLDEAVDLAHRHGSALVEAESRRSRAQLHLALGNHGAAQDDVGTALALFAQLGAGSDHANLTQWWQEL